MTSRLHRAPSLSAFRRALVGLMPLGDIAAARATALVVPTRSAAALLRRTIEDTLAPGQAVVWPDLVTRRDWYDQLAARAAEPPPMLGAYERDVLMEAAAHQAITDGATPPFQLRSPLIGEIVALYDAICRQRQDVEAFERLVLEPLAAEAEAEGDAGAERMLRQSRFLAATFRGYETRRAALARADEHTLRAMLLASGLARPYSRVIVAVADQSRDHAGLWSADYDLLARLPGLEAVDVVLTEATLATGLIEYLHDVLPGIETVRVPAWAGLSGADDDTLEEFDAPRLLVPDRDTAPEAESRARGDGFVSRDREDELGDLVRRIRAIDRDPASRVPLERVGVVFERPLPYVYLAREVFRRGGVPVETRDALPLAAEPVAAAVDLALSCPAAAFSRTSLVSLLASPHFVFGDRAAPIDRLDVAALDQALEEHDGLGDPDRLERFSAGWLDGTLRSPRARWDARRAARAASAAAGVIRALAPLDQGAPASVQLARLSAFLEAHAAPVGPGDPLAERLLRARQAIQAILAELADAHREHHDLLWTLGELAAEVRHRIEAETFTPRAGDGGVQLVDASAAPFGRFDALHLVGLVDGEWPRRPRRNIFYSSGLLATLGWPGDRPDPLAAARAAFVDLLQSAGRHVSVSTFLLEDDALVEGSPLLDDIPRAGLTRVALDVPDTRVFEDEALLLRPVPEPALDPGVAAWARLRASRPPATLDRFHGAAGPQPARARSVSAIELYSQCPFRFFARHVLRLPEERAEQDGLTPLERGRLHHELFEAIVAAWDAQGRGAVTPELLGEARAIALDVAERALEKLPAAEAALERTRLAGSPVAPGLIDVVLRLEAERPAVVIERRLEHAIDGTYTFRGADGPRPVEVRGIADRIDLLADGTFRVLDYKASKPGSTLQIAIYATCATRKLQGHRGRDWALSEAAYIAFRGDRTVVPLAKPGEAEQALAEAEAEVVAITDAIGRGRFPPRPRTRSLCLSCAFAGACRRDYVDADADTAAV